MNWNLVLYHFHYGNTPYWSVYISVVCYLVHCASYEPGEPVGISDGRIANSSFNASSYYLGYPPWKARLHSGDGNAWYGKPSDVKPWIQVLTGTLEWNIKINTRRSYCCCGNLLCQKSTATCSPMIGQFSWYHDFGIYRYRVVIMTHQSLVKFWKVFRTT